MANVIDITGTRVILDEKGCCNLHAIIARVDDECSGFRFLCCECNSNRGDVPPRIAHWLQETWRMFGPPRAPIRITRAIIDKETEMNREQIFPSKWFKAANLPQPRDLTITGAQLEELKTPQGEAQDKLILSFAGETKRLVVNSTNYDSIADTFGDETDGWIGKKVQLYADKTKLAGKPVDCVRVRVIN